MPRSLRYLLVWLSCTALTATAVFLAVRFVVGSTAPMPPTAHAMPTVFAGTPSAPGEIGTATAVPRPSPSPSASSASPSPSAPPPSPRASAPRPSPSPPADGGGSENGCPGGVGVHTMQSVGGQATVRFGSDAVCLISAVPAQGFTTSTSQSGPGTLEITFSSTDHRSQITATVQPQAQAVTRETSW